MYYCKNCGLQIAEHDIDLKTAIGRCTSCCAVASFREHPNFRGRVFTDQENYEHKDSFELTRTDEKIRMKVPMPSSITVEKLGRPLRITRKWFNYSYIFMAFACIYWDGSLIYLYYYALTSFSKYPVESTIMLLFPLIHVAIGVGFTYYTLAGLFNKTFIDVTDYEVSISHAPLPWPGAQKINSAQLKQLYCQEHISTNRRGTKRMYSVNAILKGDNIRVTLLSGLNKPEQAFFVEQEVEKYLDIPDSHVPGEMRPIED